jgi:hypothetical protein
MQWKPVVAIAAIVVVVGAFLAGYLPERQRRTAAEAEARTLRERLAAAEARVRVAALLGQALTVREMAVRLNYGQAQELASAFFNGVRAESSATPDAGFRDALNEVLDRRDAVTAALTKAEVGVIDLLQAIEHRLRRALGYALPPQPAPK